VPERISGHKTPFDLVYTELKSIGLDDEQIARRMGMSLDALGHAARRAGLKPYRKAKTS
jgi:hypothetical protein